MLTVKSLALFLLKNNASFAQLAHQLTDGVPQLSFAVLVERPNIETGGGGVVQVYQFQDVARRADRALA